MTTALREVNPTGQAVAAAQAGPSIDTIRRLLLPKGTDQELELFAMVCRKTGLDPFTGQIRALTRRAKNDGGQWEDRLSIQIGIDGFRLIAERTGDYAGQVGPHWCGDDGAWKDVWLSSDPPAAARVGVVRKGFSQPVYAIARWASYAQTNKEGQLTKMWASMPDLMLAKCAESLALRKAFPNELSGLYTDDEMSQADRPAAGHQPNPPAQDEIPALRKQLDEAVRDLAGVRGVDPAVVYAALIDAAKKSWRGEGACPDRWEDFGPGSLKFLHKKASGWLTAAREQTTGSPPPRERQPGEDDLSDDGQPPSDQVDGGVPLGGRLPEPIQKKLLEEIHEAGLDWETVAVEGLGIIGRRVLRSAHISSLSLDEAERVREWLRQKRQRRGKSRSAEEPAAA